MKPPSKRFLATATILAVGKSNALASSVRGGGSSNGNRHNDKARSHHDGESSFQRVLSRRSLDRVNMPRRAETSRSNQRQIQEEPSSYWWLNKQSSEKDIAYKPSEEEELSAYSNSLFKTHFEKEKESGLNSFSVYTMAVDKNPDTSGLPYRSPSKKPTERPTASPTKEAIADTPTPHQEVEQYTKQAVDAEKMYFYPIWADTFKGCGSSTVPPDAYLSSPSEYIFTALSECCQFWFDSAAECMSFRDRSNEDYSITMDDYMFQMNGAEAYGDGDETSEDAASLDVPTPPPLSQTSPTVANTMPPVMASLFPTPVGDVTFPPVGVVSPSPTYMPTLGNGVEVPGGGVSPPPTPATSIEYTPYPTFGDIIEATAPPVFVTVSTPSPSLNGGATMPPYGTGAVLTSPPTTAGPSIIDTAQPVGVLLTPQPTPLGSNTSSSGGTSPPPMLSVEGTPWPSFSDITTSPSVLGGAFTPQPTNAGAVNGTTAGSSTVTASGTTVGTSVPTLSFASISPSSSAGTNSTSLISDQNITKLSALFLREPLSPTPNSVIYSNSFETGSFGSTTDPYFAWSMEKSSDDVSSWEVIRTSDVNSFDGGSHIAQIGLFSGKESAVSSLTLTVRMVDSEDGSNATEVFNNGAYVTFAVEIDVEFPIDSFMFKVDDEVVRSWDTPTDGWESVSAYFPPMKMGEQYILSWIYGFFGASGSDKSGACKLDAVVVEALTGDLHMFDEQSEEDVSNVLNLHDDDGDFGWKLLEVGEGVAFEGEFSFTASTQQIAYGSNAKRLFLSHAKSDVRILSGDAKMSITVITGANGGTLEFAVLSRVAFPLDVLEIGFDGSPVTTITKVSNDWEVHTLNLIPGKHNVYFRHIVNPKNLPQSELDKTNQPVGYDGVSLVDGIKYSDNSPVIPSLFPTVITAFPTIN